MPHKRHNQTAVNVNNSASCTKQTSKSFRAKRVAFIVNSIAHFFGCFPKIHSQSMNGYLFAIFFNKQEIVVCCVASLLLNIAPDVFAGFSAEKSFKLNA